MYLHAHHPIAPRTRTSMNCLEYTQPIVTSIMLMKTCWQIFSCSHDQHHLNASMEVPVTSWSGTNCPKIVLMFTPYHIYIHTSIVCRSHAQTLHAYAWVKKWTGNSLSPRLSPYTFEWSTQSSFSLHCIIRYIVVITITTQQEEKMKWSKN